MKASAGAGGSAPVKLNGTSDAIIPVDNADAWVVGSDRMDRDAADSTKNKRAFFNKVKGAFRAGSTSTGDWNDASLGTNSTAFGSNTTASAAESFACGNGSDAVGAAAFAEGFATTASGANSHAEGSITTASGTNSHAEGGNTIASGDYSHAEGQSTTASGARSHAEGLSTTASGVDAHAEGYMTTASGNRSRSTGYQSVASRETQQAHSGGRFVADGDAQVGDMVLRRETIDATPRSLLTGTGGANGTVGLTGAATNALTIPASRAFQLKISVVARRTDVQGEMASFTWEGLVGRDSTGSARIIGTPTTDKWNDVSAALWALGVSIDTTDATNNYVKVSATGELTKTIRWVAKMDWVEVAG